jgi:hypothetical protein
VFSTPEIVSSTTVISISEGLGVRSEAATLGDRPVAPALLRSALIGVPPLPPSSEVYSDLQDMGADQYVLPEMAPSSALVGFGPTLDDCF